jgi:CRP/FNR family transcriptional regulator
LEGDPADEVLLVVEGMLRMRLMSPEGREHVVGYLTVGDYVGLASALEGEAHVATVDAMGDVVVHAIPCEVFGELLMRAPQVARDVCRRLATRVCDLTRMVDDLALHSVDARLARFLLSHAERRPSARHWTQYEIATHIGTVRDVVGRAFRNLARDGIVRRERGRLVIADRDALERLAAS